MDDGRKGNRPGTCEMIRMEKPIKLRRTTTNVACDKSFGKCTVSSSTIDLSVNELAICKGFNVTDNEEGGLFINTEVLTKMKESIPDGFGD